MANTSHTSADIEVAASAFANQLNAGIPLQSIVSRMVKLQPKHAEFWQSCADTVSRGGRLTTPLDAVWPPAIVSAIMSGEDSGSLPAVFKRVSESLRLQATIRKAAGKLISPFVAILAGLGVFIFYMVGVIPSLQKSLGGADQNLVFKVSSFMYYVFTNYWMAVLAGTVALIYFGIGWVKQEETKQWFISLLNSNSFTSPMIRNLFFGMWAYQISILDAAGLPIKTQLTLSAKGLPDCLQEGVLLMAAQVEKRGRADAANPDLQEDDDPRKEWPFYVSTAFMNAHETGDLCAEMERIAPILIDEGLKQLNKVLGVADIIAKFTAAILIALPMLGYFSQMANSLTKAFS